MSSAFLNIGQKEELQSLQIPCFVQGDFYCRKSYKNGGAGIYVKANYKFKILNYIKELSIDKHYECVEVKVFLTESDFVIKFV